MMRFLSLAPLLLAFYLVPGLALAAPCCGGAFAAPAIIAGDEAQLLTARLSSQVLAKDVSAGGIWTNIPVREETRSLRVEAATLLSDRWQVGAVVPVIERRLRGESERGLGDVSTNLAYELIPDWDYNPWRPKTIVFLQSTAPTGKPIQAATERYALDARGRGFWTVGLGALLTKSWAPLDAFLSLEGHRAFSRTLNETRFQGTLLPGWGGSVGTGIGYNWEGFRLGTSLTWTYEDPVRLQGAEASALLQRFATLAIDLTYLWSNEWATSLGYADQTKFGHPLNTSLGRALTLSLQHRWPR